MGLTSHISCFYNDFSSYRVSFSLVVSVAMMVLGLGYLVRVLFNSLKIPLVVSVDYFHLVESLEYFDLVESIEYFDLVE